MGITTSSHLADLTHEPLGRHDATLTRLVAAATRWRDTAPADRAVLLARVIADTVKEAQAWVEAASHAKGYAPGSTGAGEEWLAGPGLLIRNARLLRESLIELAGGRKPRIAGGLHTRPDGQLIAHVFPAWRYDRLLLFGVTGEIWMKPGVTRRDLASTQALAYDSPARAAGVALVLGAGNMASIGPRDALSKLFVEGKVVLLKTNPVNAYLRPHWERALACLIEDGFLAIVDADAQTSAALVEREEIDEVHLTGSSRTHDAIVFGAPESGARELRARGDVRLRKPITSELGSVSPVIVVPGPWSASDLRYQAESIVSMLVHNSGFDCLAVRALLTSASWAQRTALLECIRRSLAQTPNREPYYPGAVERTEAFRTGHSSAETFGDGAMPWVLIPGLRADAEDMCFTTEAFCGTFAEIPLAQHDSAAFLEDAVRFCNEKLWGTLAVTILVHPRSMRDPRVLGALAGAVADLRYGSVAVNVPHSLSFAATITTWGAYPGHTAKDIQSGNGVVGNTLMFSRAQKSVMRGPWRSIPKPVWFPSSRATLPASRRITEMEATPSWRTAVRLAAAAVHS